MRRVISLSLMMLFSWILIAPLFASDSDANLPACCRRNGAHHCMMRMMEQHSGQQQGLTSVLEKWPCYPTGACAAYSLIFKSESGDQFFANVVCHPTAASHAEALYHISSFRSNPKRGPPLA
jgi:hypothetical protein